ncbi:hypothetical protein LTR66_000944 [Elasticomyces elasticus]|nr:hypothetical protein LTR66_000944 [Elasticomyces elasticus]
MNDPGTDEPIREAARDVEAEQSKDQARVEREEEQEFLDPSRWWFTSTACPLLAGTFGPQANAFNLCALVEYWRVYIPPEGTEEHGVPLKDPAWLIAINAISFVLAIVANMALLLNMARKLRFSIAQPITILGFFFSAVLLIVDLSVASSKLLPELGPHDHYALTSAFYYGVMSVAIYIIISALMCLTVWGAHRGHYEKEFRLTTSQRTLMLQTIAFMMYLLLGALVFSKIEGWQYLEAVYWADITLLTVGLGDYNPSTHLGRSLLFPFAIGGIVMIGLVIGSIRSLVLEHGKAKLSARIAEKKRRNAVEHIDREKRTIRISWWQRMQWEEHGLSESAKREQEFYVMRSVQDRAEQHRRYMALAVSVTAALTLWFAGAAVFYVAEKNQQWTCFESLYFSYTSLLTIGYGSPVPLSNSGRPFFVFWSLLAVPTLTILISNMGETVVKTFSDVTIWIGELTVLPGENGIRASTKSAIKAISGGRGKFFIDSKDFSTQQPPGFLASSRTKANGSGYGSHQELMRDRITDHMMSHLEEEELEAVHKADQHGNTLERDVSFYRFVLVKECRNVMRDLVANPSKQYEYHEWEYFLKLMGDDESVHEGHRKPLAHTTLDEEEKEEETEHRVSQKGEEIPTDDMKPWSWLGKRSPLMGSKSEAEWILEHLTLTLEKQVSIMRLGQRPRRPPISMRDLIKGTNGQKSENREAGSGSDIDVEKAEGRPKNG